MPAFLLFLQGYLPANVDRRPATLQRKQKEYFAFIEHYYNSRNDEVHQDTYRQVSVLQGEGSSLFHSSLNTGIWRWFAGHAFHLSGTG